MKIVSTESDAATVQFTKSELQVLASAINEALEELEEWEFSTRVGIESWEAASLQSELRNLLSSMK